MLLRTILISGLSAYYTARNVLTIVRGGLILDAQLVQDPAQRRAALITFLDENAAAAYAQFAENYLSHHHSRYNSQR